MLGHGKVTAIYKSGREPSPKTESTSTLILDFPSLQKREKISLTLSSVPHQSILR